MRLADRLRPDPLGMLEPRPLNLNWGGVILLREREGRGVKGRGKGGKEG